jgi:5-methylcytosine-specific restriction endonuclease McrA
MAIAKPRKPKVKPVKKIRSRISPGIRYDALVRANFRCEACGVLARNARLEIDHKKPIAKGGTNAIANLQVLCVSCNRGKGAKLRKAKNVH